MSPIPPHRPVLTAVARVAVVAAIAGGVVVACGVDDGTDVALGPAAQAGREITRANGCSACHGRNGEGEPGPAFTGLYGSTVELEGGETVVADAEYLFESIRDPGAERVAGYGFPMPGNDLTDAEIESVIAYIEALAAPAADDEAAG